MPASIAIAGTVLASGGCGVTTTPASWTAAGPWTGTSPRLETTAIAAAAAPITAMPAISQGNRPDRVGGVLPSWLAVEPSVVGGGSFALDPPPGYDTAPG
jgi:hypothetical protein